MTRPPPPGCPAGWPIKLTAQSGIQIAWGPPHSRQQPGATSLRGIGIKMRHIGNVPGYPEHTESWAGLYEQKLHELYWRFQIHSQGEMVLHLPMMGMPPREPTQEMIREVRAGQQFSSFFKYATVIKATDLDLNEHQCVRINETRGLGNTIGDDVVIRLPIWPEAPEAEDSLYRRTMDDYGFEFRTHLPSFDDANKPENVDLSRLYFIQLLPNELPSFHFWASPTADSPGASSKNRTILDGPGSPHYQDLGASRRQCRRLSPQNSRTSSNTTRSTPRAPPAGPKESTKRPRPDKSSSSDITEPPIKKPRTKAASQIYRKAQAIKKKLGKSSRRTASSSFS